MTRSLIFSLLMTLCFTSVIGQITITRQHMPASGDTLRYSRSAPTGVNPGNGGANVSWKFLNLTPISQGVDEYISSFKTPYILNFGFSAIGLKIADTLGFGPASMTNVFRFYRNTNNSYSDVGMGFQFGPLPLPQAGKHSDPDEIYTFPLEFGDIDTTTFDVTIPIKAGPIEVGSLSQTGTRINVVDGWGKISTPFATDVSCLRVKSTILSQDTVSVSTLNINFGTQTKRIEYKWLSTTEHMPLLSISGNEVNGNFVITEVKYRDSFRRMGPIREINPQFTADRTTSKPGVVITLTNETDGVGLSYNWAVDPSSSVKFVNGTSSTSESPKIVVTDTGYYTVKLVASGFGSSDSIIKYDYLHITNSTGVNEQIMNGFRIAPNPSTDFIRIDWNTEARSMRYIIISASGQLVQEGSVLNHNIINISELPSGPYQLHIFDRHRSTTSMVIKQ